jgi:hypothetical protein
MSSERNYGSFKYVVGFLGRRIDLRQANLHRTTETWKETRTCIHASSWIRIYDPSVSEVKHSTCLTYRSVSIKIKTSWTTVQSTNILFGQVILNCEYLNFWGVSTSVLFTRQATRTIFVRKRSRSNVGWKIWLVAYTDSRLRPTYVRDACGLGQIPPHTSPLRHIAHCGSDSSRIPGPRVLKPIIHSTITLQSVVGPKPLFFF